jgi:hypothetical protein
MNPVIQQGKWLRWCERQALPVDGAPFALETCYYGLGWRTRPGTLLLTEAELIHHSYSWGDTFYAMFEPSIRIVLRLSEIAHATIFHPNLGRRLFHSLPDAFLRIVTRRGEIHDLLLQRRAEEFFDALRRRGVSVNDERNAEPDAAPNGGPATRLGNSGATEGPPSVS